MADSGFAETVKIRKLLLKRLEESYKATSAKIGSESESYIDRIYLSDEKATPSKRLKHAKDNELEELAYLIATYIIIENNSAIEEINKAIEEVVHINVISTTDYINSIAGTNIDYDMYVHGINKYTKKAFGKSINRNKIYNELISTLKIGIRKGDSKEALDERIQKIINRYENSALLTTMIELTAAMNMARLEIAKLSGIPTVKVWRHIDPKLQKHPRDWHLAQDGEERELDEAFSNGLQFPCEPGAPAVEVCNCACYIEIRKKE